MSTLQNTDLFAVGRGTTSYRVTFSDVRSGSITISGIAPTSPASGFQWLDSVNEVLSIYDGSKWVSIANQMLIDGGSAATIYTSIPSIDGGNAA